MNKENLAILATYLEKLPPDYREFEMACFYESEDDSDEHYIKTGNKCGTAACAAGHGPAAGLLLTWQDLESRHPWSGTWVFYLEKIFGVAWDTPECRWIFGGGWTDHDNTHRGAAARIRFLLDDDVALPEMWENNDDDCYHHMDQFIEMYQEYVV